MLLGPTDLFWIGILPCVTAAVLLLAAGRLGVRPTAAWSLSVAGGFVVGAMVRNARVDWRSALEKLFHPHAAIDWLPWLVLVAAAIGALAAYAPRDWQRWLVALAGLYAIAVPMRLLAANAAAAASWSASEKLASLAFWSAAFALGWLTLALGRRNQQPLVRGGLLVVVALGISITLAASGAITLGELGGIATASLVGTLAIAWRIGPLADGPSQAAGPSAVLFGSLILVGYSYDLSATNAALLAAALFASAGWLPKLPRDGEVGWGESVLRIALTLVPLALAVVSSISTALAETYG